MSIMPKEVRHLVHSMIAQNNKPASILRRFPCFWDVDDAKRFFTSTSKLIERSKDVREILSQVEHDFKNRCNPNIKACMLDVESYDDTLYGFVWWYRNLVRPKQTARKPLKQFCRKHGQTYVTHLICYCHGLIQCLQMRFGQDCQKCH